MVKPRQSIDGEYAISEFCPVHSNLHSTVDTARANENKTTHNGERGGMTPHNSVISRITVRATSTSMAIVNRLTNQTKRTLGRILRYIGNENLLDATAVQEKAHNGIKPTEQKINHAS